MHDHHNTVLDLFVDFAKFLKLAKIVLKIWHEHTKKR